MPAGTVTEFDPVKGFGTLELASGEELPFDIAASNKRDVQVGDRGEVTIGVGWTGKPKAKLVVFELESDLAPSFAIGFEQLRTIGFLREWTLADLRAAAEQLYVHAPQRLLRAAAGELLERYYDRGSTRRGRADGVIICDRDGDISPERLHGLRAICPTPMPARWVPFDSVAPLIAQMNAWLDAEASAVRFYCLDIAPDADLIACRSLDFAERVTSARWLALR